MTQTSTTTETTVVFVRSGPLNITPAVGRYVNNLKRAGYPGRIVGIQLAFDTFKGERERVEVDKMCTFAGQMGSKARGLMTYIAWQFFQTIQLSRLKPAVVQFCDVASVVPALWTKYVHGTKLVFDIRDNVGAGHKSVFTNVLAAIERFAAKKSDVIIIVRDGRKEFLPRGVEDRIFVIPNTPFHDVEAPAITHPHPAPMVINVSGYLGKWRNIPALCAATRLCKDIKLDVYGNVYDNSTMRHFVDAGVDNIESIPNDKALKRMGSADMVAIMYDDRIHINKYADSNKYYEALMLGKAVLCTKMMELAEEVEHYGCGFAVEYDRPDQILEAVSIMKNKGAEVSWNARKLFEEKYRGLFQSRALKMYESISLLEKGGRSGFAA